MNIEYLTRLNSIGIFFLVQIFDIENKIKVEPNYKIYLKINLPQKRNYERN